MATLYLATPYTRPFEAEYVMSLFQTRNPGTTIWQPLGNKPPDSARNLLVMGALDKKADFILFADSDATWHPEAVERLMSRDLPIVTGCIYRRKIPPQPTIGQYVGTNPAGHHVYEFASTIRRIITYMRERGLDESTDNALCLDPTDEVNDLVEVDGTGAHFLLIKREVLESIRLPWFRGGKNGAGEDFYFCRKAKAAGWPIYMDLTVHTGHIAGSGCDFGVRELLAWTRWVKDVSDISADEEVWDVGK